MGKTRDNNTYYSICVHKMNDDLYSLILYKSHLLGSRKIQPITKNE